MRRFSGGKAAAALAALLLASCSTVVDGVRDVTGTSKNDPGPEARNTRNLEAGSERPFPNLGTVPPPPVRALSTAEREALQKSLAADRANAKYIDEQLRAGQTASAPRPAPRPPTPPAEEAAPPPAAAAPRQAAPSAAQISPAPAATERAPAPAAPGPMAAAPSSEPPPEPPPAAAPRTPVEAQELPNESPGVSPEVRSVPEPEAPQPAPPKPVLSGPGVPATRPPAAPPPASVPRAAPAPSSSQLASLPPGQPVAEIAFARDSAALPGSDRSRIEEVAAAQRARGGIVRVVAEAAPAGGADGALAAFGLALDRANAVALALAEAGVPQQRIQVETAPPGRAPGRARVYLQN